MLSFKDFQKRSSESKLPLRERFFRGSIFTVGQTVEGINHLGESSTFEILGKGSNYVTTITETGNIAKWFVDKLTLVEDANIPSHDPDGGFSFKGYTPSNVFQKNEQAVDAFRETVQKYEDGKISDAIAIAMAIKSVDIFLGLMELAVVDRESVDIKLIQAALNKATEKLTQIGEFQHHQDYIHSLADTLVVSKSKQSPMDENMDIIKQTDKLKVASMIASAYGVDSTKNNAEVMVSSAIRAARRDPAWNKTKHVLHGMLDIAKSVGIQFDEKMAEVNESSLKETHLSVGDSVWVKHPTEKSKTLTGKVSRVGRTGYDVQHKDGTKGWYVHKDVSSDYPHKNPYASQGKLSEEELDELSIGTMTSYSDKAKSSATKLMAQGAKAKKIETSYGKFKKASTRLKSVDTAKKKIFSADWKQRTGQNESEETVSFPKGPVSQRGSVSTIHKSEEDFLNHAEKFHGKITKKTVSHPGYFDSNVYHNKNGHIVGSGGGDYNNKNWSWRLYSKPITESYKSGDTVTVDNNGRTMGGKVKGMHGSVVEVSHKNGKVGFYHSHKVSINEDQKADGPVDPKEYKDLVAVHSGLRYEKHPEPFAEQTKPGHSFQYSNDTHRHQMVNKIKGDH